MRHLIFGLKEGQDILWLLGIVLGINVNELLFN